MTKTKPQTSGKTERLSDTALVLLSQASDRTDGSLLPAPASLKASGGALRRVLNTLLTRGLIEEFACNEKEQTWRSKEEGDHLGLRITRAGLTAIGVPTLQEIGSGSTDAKHDEKTPGERVQEKTSAASSIRPGSKQALLVEELRRPEGARIDDLVGTLGWLPHTVRAALTGLRKKGFSIERDRDGEGSTIYRTPTAVSKELDKCRARTPAGAQS